MDKRVDDFLGHVESGFGDRIVFLGLQGSYARGEAGPDSDIDIVLILDRVDEDDLSAHRAFIAASPLKGKLCGFFSGKAELLAWERSDLLNLFLDSIPVKGSLDFLSGLFTKEVIENAVRTAACAVYHAAVHTILHPEAGTPPPAVAKAAAFAVRLDHCRRTGRWVSRFADLADEAGPDERKILVMRAAETDLAALAKWSGGLLQDLPSVR